MNTCLQWIEMVTPHFYIFHPSISWFTHLKPNGWAEHKLFFVLWWLAVSPVMEKGPGDLDESYVTKETIISLITALCSNAAVILERQWMRFIASLRGKRLPLTKQVKECDMTAAAKNEEWDNNLQRLPCDFVSTSPVIVLIYFLYLTVCVLLCTVCLSVNFLRMWISTECYICQIVQYATNHTMWNTVSLWFSTCDNK